MSSPLTTLRHVLGMSELRNKILFTLFVIAIYRLGALLPAPGVNLDAIEQLRAQAEDSQAGIFAFLNVMTGGTLGSLSLFSLGIIPYITASIIIQILTVAIPKLEEWQSQGSQGQAKINQWTRYISVVLALVQATGLVFLINRNQSSMLNISVELFPEGGVVRMGLAVMCMTVGVAILMWLGELITQKGIGNGMSLLIMASVVASLPALGTQIHSLRGWGGVAISLVFLVVLTAGIVFVEQGQRRIPVNFAKRVVGRRQYGGNNTYIPLKVNQAGVIPVIFATSLLQLPTLVANVLPSNAAGDSWGDSVRDFISSSFYQPDNIGYILIVGLLIVGFAYFYNSIAFDPVRRADELRRSGGFIPGIRPGTQTEHHLAKILNRITLPGAIFLALVALIPSAILARTIGAGSSTAGLLGFSGVSILIAVGVGLETMKQIDSQLMSRNYEGFLK